MTQCDRNEDADPSFCVRLRTRHVTPARMAACFNLLLNLFVNDHNRHRYHNGHRRHNDGDDHHHYDGDARHVTMI